MTIQILNDDFYIKEFGWNRQQFDIIRDTYCKGISLDEIKVFGHVCRHTKLDPLLKQIYAIPRGGKMTIQTSIDGYRLIAERTGHYSPGRESTYVYDDKNPKQLISATSYIKKMTRDGTWHEIGATAYYEEYCSDKGTFWKKMPHVMLAKCAEALALRKAFPAELSGLYTEDEMKQAEKMEDRSPQEAAQELICKVEKLDFSSEQEKKESTQEELPFMDVEKCLYIENLLKQTNHTFVENMMKYIRENWKTEIPKFTEDQFGQMKSWCLRKFAEKKPDEVIDVTN